MVRGDGVVSVQAPYFFSLSPRTTSSRTVPRRIIPPEVASVPPTCTFAKKVITHLQTRTLSMHGICLRRTHNLRGGMEKNGLLIDISEVLRHKEGPTHMYGNSIKEQD